MFHPRFNSAMRARADPAGGRTCRAMLTRLLAIGPPSSVLIRWTGEDERQHFAAPRAFRRHERSSDPRGEPTPAWRRQDFTERAFQRHLRGSQPRPGVTRTSQTRAQRAIERNTREGAIPGLASPGLHRHGPNERSSETHGREPFPAWRRQDFTSTGPNRASERNTREGAIPGVAVKSWRRQGFTDTGPTSERENIREGAIPGLDSPGLHRDCPNEPRATHTGGNPGLAPPGLYRHGLAPPGLHRHWPSERHTGGAVPCLASPGLHRHRPGERHTGGAVPCLASPGLHSGTWAPWRHAGGAVPCLA
jgi:hypothetical protein